MWWNNILRSSSGGGGGRRFLISDTSMEEPGWGLLRGPEITPRGNFLFLYCCFSPHTARKSSVWVKAWLQFIHLGFLPSRHCIEVISSPIQNQVEAVTSLQYGCVSVRLLTVKIYVQKAWCKKQDRWWWWWWWRSVGVVWLTGALELLTLWLNRSPSWLNVLRYGWHAAQLLFFFLFLFFILKSGDFFFLLN